MLAQPVAGTPSSPINAFLRHAPHTCATHSHLSRPTAADGAGVGQGIPSHRFSSGQHLRQVPAPLMHRLSHTCLFLCSFICFFPIWGSNGSLSIPSVVDVFRDMHDVDSMRQLLQVRHSSSLVADAVDFYWGHHDNVTRMSAQILDRWVVAFPALRTAKRRCAAVLASPDFSSSSAPPPFPAPQAARLPSSSSPSSSSAASSFSLAPSSYPDPRT